MPATSIEQVFPTFTDIDGQPLEDGYIWVGTVNLDPQTNPISIFSDAALTVSLSQPVRTIGGYPVSSGTPIRIYANSEYSVRVMNKNGSVVYSAPSPTARYPSSLLPDDSVTTPKIVNLNVTTGKLANGAATLAKLDTTGASGAVLTAQGAGNAPVWATPQSVAQVQPISASVSANALTISASALSLDFRSTTLGSGTVTRVSGTPANLVISSGSTLGTVNGVQSDIAVLAINNAGTIELAAVNIAGGVDLSETGLISTTAEGGAGAADSATVVYSTTARTNVAYRVIGVVRSTQATAGTWATAPSLIQGAGGQAITAMSSLGYGQTWQNVTGSRAKGTTYYNTTGRPIVANINCTENAVNSYSGLTVAGLLIANNNMAHGTNVNVATISAVIPPGASYVWADIVGTATLTSWAELR